jgi:large subunit ribosomal protein L29
MKIKDIRALTSDEVATKLEDTREELFKLRFQFATGQLTDYSRLGRTRRDIARLETVLRERELAAEILAAQSVEAEAANPVEEA